MKLRQLSFSLVGLTLIAIFFLAANSSTVQAANPAPVAGSIGLEGTISTAPPKTAATIGVPSNGASFTSIPITVSGLCPSNVIVKVFSNNVFVGSALCVNGSFSLQIDLFSGRNDLVARVYDALDQAGPDSSTVTVTFSDAQFLQLGSQVTLSSNYAERGAPPNVQIDWPIQLNGGTGPYAISVDWGDNSPSDLQSSSSAGTITLHHAYKAAGVYKVIVKATDKNGNSAFLQLIGQATGAIQSNSSGNTTNGNNNIQTKILWWPIIVLVAMIFVSFWIGKRYQLKAIQEELRRTRG